MKLITRDTDYAMRVLRFMALWHGKRFTVGEIAKTIDVPHAFLRRILQTLNRHKIVHSYKGIGGGFVFEGNPKKIRLIDIMKIFQGSVSLNECTLRLAVCPEIRICALRKKLNRIESFVLGQLRSITLDALLCRKGKARGKT